MFPPVEFGIVSQSREEKMPVELQIIRAADFIRMGGHGQFDLAASCAVLTELAQACKRRGIHRALLDARTARAELSPSELASLVGVFQEIGFSKNDRLAILHAVDRPHRSRLFALMSRMKGWNVHAFVDFEEALCWLSGYQDEPQPRAAASAQRVVAGHSDGPPQPVSIKPHPRRKTGQTEFIARTHRTVTHAP
jgi:hypothetical protein